MLLLRNADVSQPESPDNKWGGTLLKNLDTAFITGDKSQCGKTSADPKRGISEAKEASKRKIEDHLTDNDPHSGWGKTTRAAPAGLSVLMP